MLTVTRCLGKKTRNIAGKPHRNVKMTIASTEHYWSDLSAIVLEFLGGNVGGYLIGRGFLKLAKLLMTLVGIVGALFTMAVATLASRGYITVEWTKVSSDIQGWLSEIVTTIASQAPSISALQSFLGTYLPLGSGTLTGFALALKTS